MKVEGSRRRTRLRARWLGSALAAAAAFAVGVVVASAGGRDDPRAHEATAQSTAVIVSDRSVGRPISAGFLGLSFEYPAVTFYTRSAPNGDPLLVHLIRNLLPGQAPVLRIGGDSTDTSWWPVPGSFKPPWVKYTLTPEWIAGTHSLAVALGARLILGINLEANSATIAAAEAKALVSGIGRRYIVALELGNEPEVYGSLPWYDAAAGKPVYARPSWYSSNGLESYEADFSRIRAALPDVPLAGPATGGMRQLAHLSQLIASEPGLRLVTFHRYPLNRCFVTADSPEQATLANLLTPRASRGLVTGLEPFVTIAHRHRLSFRIDETNSVACGGKLGLSDTFASALWVIDALFSMARSGVDGVNIHIFPGARYSLFQFRRSTFNRRVLVHPEYYGLLMFARAVPPGARLLTVRAIRAQNIRAWAARGPDGTRRIVLINDSRSRARIVFVRVSPLRVNAGLERLLAPGIRSTSGVTIAGQGFGVASQSGMLAGRYREERVRPTAFGYEVMLPAASAALLTVPPA